MAVFWKAAAGILTAVVLVLAVGKQEKDLALMLTMAVCVMAVGAALSFLEPVISFLYRLEELGDLQSGVLEIGLVSEIAEMICKDSGNASLAKGMELLGSAVILSLSLPILETFLDLIQRILGEI